MTDIISTPEAARKLAQTWLDEMDPEITANFITLVAKRYQDVGPSLYARYLVSVAFREALLPNGWFDAPAFSEFAPINGHLCVLDVVGMDSDEFELPQWPDYEEPIYSWPSEQQVIDWNEHNAHVDGADYDDV